MSMHGKIKVKYVGKGEKGFVNGNVYAAYEVKSNMKNSSNIICVVDDFGEEYALPKTWFKEVLIDDSIQRG